MKEGFCEGKKLMVMKRTTLGGHKWIGFCCVLLLDYNKIDVCIIRNKILCINFKEIK